MRMRPSMKGLFIPDAFRPRHLTCFANSMSAAPRLLRRRREEYAAIDLNAVTPDETARMVHALTDFRVPPRLGYQRIDVVPGGTKFGLGEIVFSAVGDSAVRHALPSWRRNLTPQMRSAPPAKF